MTIFTKHAFFINIPYINKILKLCCGYVSLTHSFVCIWLILSRVIICHEALCLFQVKKLNSVIAEKKSALSPLIKDLRALRQEHAVSDCLASSKILKIQRHLFLPHTENHYQLQRANQHISSVRIAFSFVLLVKTGARSRV